jgi:hypothetical protein
MARAINTGSIVIEAWETYTKQSFRNRCNIYGPNGLQTLIIPVIKVNGNHTLVRDIRISNRQPWQTIHWRSITTAYNNSPFFLYYQDLFIPIFEKRFDYLLDFNTKLLEVIIQSLKTNISVGISSEFTPSLPDGSREQVVSKKFSFTHPEYVQVFSVKSGFLSNLSTIDLLFNLGPESRQFLSNLGQ